MASQMFVYMTHHTESLDRVVQIGSIDLGDVSIDRYATLLERRSFNGRRIKIKPQMICDADYGFAGALMRYWYEGEDQTPAPETIDHRPTPGAPVRHDVVGPSQSGGYESVTYIRADIISGFFSEKYEVGMTAGSAGMAFQQYLESIKENGR